MWTKTIYIRVAAFFFDQSTEVSQLPGERLSQDLQEHPWFQEKKKAMENVAKM